MRAGMPESITGPRNGVDGETLHFLASQAWALPVVVLRAMKAPVQSPTLTSRNAIPRANRLDREPTLTRKDICADLGINPSTLYRWEREEGLTFVGRRIKEGHFAFWMECRECARRLKIPTVEFLRLTRDQIERNLALAHMMRSEPSGNC